MMQAQKSVMVYKLFLLGVIFLNVVTLQNRDKTFITSVSKLYAGTIMIELRPN
jgi:hypothetical protein